MYIPKYFFSFSFISILLAKKFCYAKEKLTLDMAFNIALSENRKLKISEKNIAFAKKDASLLTFIPNVHASLTLHNSPEDAFALFENAKSSISLSIPINLFEKLMSYKQKEIKIYTSENEFQLKKLDCLANVAKNFFSALCCQKILSFLQKNLEISKIKLEEYNKKLSMKIISINEYNEFLLGYNMDLSKLMSAENNFNEAKNKLKKSLDWQTEEDFEVEGNFYIDEKKLEDCFSTTNGEVHIEDAIHKRKLINLKRKAAYANFLPTLSTNFSKQIGGANGEQGNYSIGISLGLDIYKCINVKRDIDLIDIELDNENLSQGIKTYNLNEKRKNSMQKIKEYMKTLSLAKINVELSSKIYEEYLRKFDLKLISRLELEEKKKKFHDSKIFLEESQLTIISSVLDLLWISGNMDQIKYFYKYN